MSEDSHKSPSPWSSELDRFLAYALASYLLSFPELNEAVDASHAGQGDPNAVDRLCEHLISNRTLTKWQCDKLRNGQYKGFFFERYKFLEPDPSHAAYHFIAEDVESHRRVKLFAKPNASLPGGVEYRVVEE